ncbi:hypothetical protein E2542_SST21132 [Spatholobus suberectus]|nr:hypothetical protein E2542_SST21132 [Spatholobus suberectus]
MQEAEVASKAFAVSCSALKHSLHLLNSSLCAFSILPSSKINQMVAQLIFCGHKFIELVLVAVRQSSSVSCYDRPAAEDSSFIDVDDAGSRR